MKEQIHVTNKTMELCDCRNDWSFNEEYQCWCLEDILYTSKAVVPETQRLSIFVPAVYMNSNGEINEKGSINGYTAETVPVVFENNSAGYMPMPHVKLGEERCLAKQYLERGFVYITAGNRGSESKNEKGEYCGKSPVNLVDIKTAIRFLRHNAMYLPGDFSHMISVGYSAGGAMSTLLAVTGNNEKFDAYLEENGAFMEESDAVFAAQIYCPIVDLENADLAYEWMFSADKTTFGGANEMSTFQKALSDKLKSRYINYFNSLKLVHPETKEILKLDEDGRSGSGYEYLMHKIDESASIFLTRLEKKELEKIYSVEEYLSGTYEGVDAKAKKSWLDWDGKKAHVSDLDSYVLNHRRRLKSCPSFDVFDNNSCENKVFGSQEEPCMHFNLEIAKAIAELKEEFPVEYEKYYTAYANAEGDKELEKRVYLYNPHNFIGTSEKSEKAKYYRIRVGASDADTSFSVSMALALKLLDEGHPVDYQLVWEEPHCEADYPGEVCDWIEEICR